MQSCPAEAHTHGYALPLHGQSTICDVHRSGCGQHTCTRLECRAAHLHGAPGTAGAACALLLQTDPCRTCMHQWHACQPAPLAWAQAGMVRGLVLAGFDLHSRAGVKTRCLMGGVRHHPTATSPEKKLYGHCCLSCVVHSWDSAADEPRTPRLACGKQASVRSTGRRAVNRLSPHMCPRLPPALADLTLPCGRWRLRCGIA